MCHRNENCLILASLWIHSGFPKGVPVAYIFSIRRRVVVLHVLSLSLSLSLYLPLSYFSKPLGSIHLSILANDTTPITTLIDIRLIVAKNPIIEWKKNMRKDVTLNALLK
jgi:hypothetical protein